jgi:hypothetical protein
MRMVRDVIGVSLVACVLCGCNEHYRPLALEPMNEVMNATSSVEVMGTTIRVPSGWRIATVWREEVAAGDATSVMLDRCEGTELVATILFSRRSEGPKWLKEAGPGAMQTQEHGSVQYWIAPATAPSGDDTPGKYGVRAYVTDPDGGWEMIFGSNRPVVPELIACVNYIDAIRVKSNP